MAFEEVWKANEPVQGKLDLELSVYISERSSWTKGEIKNRIQASNQTFHSCDVQISQVYFHSWLPSDPLLRLDEYISERPYYDGLRHASFQSKKVTDLQLFYFQNYQEGMTSGPALPLAVYPDEDLEPETFNTAWFPYESAQRLRSLGHKYNEEAHEIGHILLQTGHTHDGVKNILANNSKDRTPHFTPTQCERLRQHPALNKTFSERMLPLFSSYFSTYSKDFYMTDWCSRNSRNLSKGLSSIFSPDFIDAQQVFVVHREKGRSLRPQNTRKPVSGWKFHSFLLLRSQWVLDLDYGKVPKIENFKDYLLTMFPGQIDDLRIVLMDPEETQALTYLEVRALFDSTPKTRILDFSHLFGE